MADFETLLSAYKNTVQETSPSYSSDLSSRVAALESQVATIEFRENNTAKYAAELERKIKRIFKILKQNKIKMKLK